MKETKFEKAKKRVEDLLVNVVDEQFFTENYIGIHTTTTTYLILKKAYNEKEVDYFGDFKSVFSQFYGIKRFVDDNFINKYYTQMNELRGKKEYDVRQLTKDLIDNDGKIQFSFATKMLNIMNDEKYPIYDSNVAKAFAIYTIDSKNLEDKIDNYVTNYAIIEKVYTELLEKHKQIITNFREVFKYTEKELSDMRIIDIIVWKIGEKLINKQLKIE